MFSNRIFKSPPSSRRSYSTPKSFNEIPGPAVNPTTSTFEHFLSRIQQTDINQAINSYYPEYGNIVKHKIHGRDEVWIYHPDDITHTLKNDNAIPVGGSTDLWSIHAYGQKKNFPFPLNASDESWRRTRMAIQKDIFPPQAAALYVPNLNEPAKRASKVFNKAPFDQLMPYTAFDLFANAILGKNFYSAEKSVDPNHQKDDSDLFVEHGMKALAEMIHLEIYMDNSHFPEFEKSMDTVIEYSEKFLLEASKKPDFAKGDSYFSRVVARKELEFKEIVSTVCSFLLAGVDTTTSLSLWILLNLGRFPEVQEKLYQEIASVVGDGPVTAKHIEQLQYMRQVLRESHRFTSNLAFTSARRLDHPIVLSGYEIPAGVKILFAPNAIQHDPRYVDEPEKFIPERWSKSAVAERTGTEREGIDGLVVSKPFGSGPRMCLGARLAEAEIRVFLCHLLRDWKFSWDPSVHKYQVIQNTFTLAAPFPEMKMMPR